MSVSVSKEIEFDAGHRIRFHGSKCKFPHGHRYRVRATCEGDVVTKPGADEGMVVDFGLLKKWLTEEIHDVLDHGFMVQVQDVDMLEAILSVSDEDHVICFSFAPTAENLAWWCYDQIGPLVAKHWNGLRLAKIELWETPTSMVVYKP